MEGLCKHSCPACLPVITFPASGGRANYVVATTMYTGLHRCHNDVVTVTGPAPGHGPDSITMELNGTMRTRTQCGHPAYFPPEQVGHKRSGHPSGISEV